MSRQDGPVCIFARALRNTRNHLERGRIVSVKILAALTLYPLAVDIHAQFAHGRISFSPLGDF